MLIRRSGRESHKVDQMSQQQRRWWRHGNKERRVNWHGSTSRRGLLCSVHIYKRSELLLSSVFGYRAYITFEPLSQSSEPDLSMPPSQQDTCVSFE